MTEVNMTRTDYYDPYVPRQLSGFASPANVVKKLYCNRLNLFGNFTQQVAAPTSPMNVEPYQDPNALKPCPGIDKQSIHQLLGPNGKNAGTVTSVTCIQLDSTKTQQIVIGFDVKTVNPLVLATPNQVCSMGFRVQGSSFDVIACSTLSITIIQPQLILMETDKILTSCSSKTIELKGEGYCGVMKINSTVTNFFNSANNTVIDSTLLNQINNNVKPQVNGKLLITQTDIAAMAALNIDSLDINVDLVNCLQIKGQQLVRFKIINTEIGPTI